MAQINEAKKNTLATLGYTGSVDDAYHNYLVAESGQNLLSTQDLEKYLFSELGYTGAVYDMWFEFLRDNGFTNSLQDMLHAFWNSDSAGLSPLYFSELYAPLTHSLVLERGTGSPTFTRASTATFRDWEGVLKTVPSGCARFEGARMIYNLIADLNAASRKSNDFTLWTASNATAVGNTVTFGAPAGAGSYIYTGGSLSLGNVAFRTFVASATVSCAAGTEAFQLGINDTGASTYVSGDFIATTTPQRVSFVKTLGGVNAGVGMLITNSDAGGAKTIIVEDAQLEDVTGQADQTASEYVSVGVESAPYHGAGVDGVEFFNTDRDGAVLPAATNTGYLAEGSRENKCLQSNAFTTTWAAYNAGTATQNVVGPDGATSAWTLTDNSAVAAMGVRQSITLTAATHTISLFVKKTTGAQTSYPVVYLDDNVSKGASCTVDTTNGVATVWTAYTGLTIVTSSASCVSHNADYWRVSLTLLATAASWTLYLLPAATTNATQSTGVWDVAAQGSAVFYGAQVELGSSASTYTATGGAAVTRAADVLTYPSAGNIDGTVGWCYLEASMPAAGAASSKYLISGTSGNNLVRVVNNGLYAYDGTANRIFAGVTEDGTPQNLALTWGGTATNAAINGVLPGAQGFDGDFDLGAALGIGIYVPSGTEQPFGTIRNLRIGQRQLSASEMQAITS